MLPSICRVGLRKSTIIGYLQACLGGSKAKRLPYYSYLPFQTAPFRFSGRRSIAHTDHMLVTSRAQAKHIWAVLSSGVVSILYMKYKLQSYGDVSAVTLACLEMTSG